MVEVVAVELSEVDDEDVDGVGPLPGRDPGAVVVRDNLSTFFAVDAVLVLVTFLWFGGVMGGGISPFWISMFGPNDKAPNDKAPALVFCT